MKKLLVLVLVPTSSINKNTDVMTTKSGTSIPLSSGVVSDDYRNNYDRIFSSKKPKPMVN